MKPKQMMIGKSIWQKDKSLNKVEFFIKIGIRTLKMVTCEIIKKIAKMVIKKTVSRQNTER